MNIGVYFHLSRVGLPNGNGRYRIEPTGVGKHTLYVLLGLSALPDMHVTALVPRGDLDPLGRIPADFPVASLPVAALPYSRRAIETRWTVFNSPKIDRWYPDGDWIYCPQEAFVATRRARLAVTVHDTYDLEPDRHFDNSRVRARVRFRWKLLYRAIRRRADLILAVSEFTKSRLVALLGFDPRRVVVVGNAVDDLFFDPPAPAQSQDPLPPSPYVLVVGGLAVKKGGDYLLAAARRLERARPDMKIVVCGVSNSPYKELADAIPNMIRFGYVPVDRYMQLLRGASALLMLSRYEGFGIPAAEAMAAGIPAIVSGFASLPEVVGDGGIVVDARDADQVVVAIDRVQGDRSFREDLVARGRHRAAAFRREALVRRFCDALRNGAPP